VSILHGEADAGEIVIVVWRGMDFEHAEQWMPPHGLRSRFGRPAAPASHSGKWATSGPSGFRASDRVVFVEVIAAILLVGGATALASSGDLCVSGADVHPLWIPVLVFAARYGVRGLFISVALAAVALAAISLVEHGALVEVAARGSNPHDLIALVAATLVAWTAMIRDHRLARLGSEHDEMRRRLVTSTETAGALRDVVGVLRDRLDRIDLSISMWRAIAERMDHGPLRDRAAAALELATIRSGAASGVVYRNMNGRLLAIATHGHSGGTTDIGRDRTVRLAVAQRRPALRSDVAGSSLDDSEVAVPIVDSKTQAVVGVLAMRDASPGRLRAAEVHDLEVVAAWFADAFQRPQVRAKDGAC
jgi:hypothetical protein